jgi:AraC-like DNA-binding protein/quercetin dioxygenase-like cupin family protein
MTRSDAGAGVAGHDHGKGWIKRAESAGGLERIEAFFAGRGYDMHRHDTYAIGHTLAGVQSFQYRGAVRNSLPGGTVVLHPDEKHDGQAGAEGGFRYRLIYVQPAAIQEVLGGRALPFIDGGLSADARLYQAAGRFLRPVEERTDAFEYEDALFDLAHALDSAGGGGAAAGQKAADYRAASLARAWLDEAPEDGVSMVALERVTGRNRWSLSRDFRLLFGTSPYRYVTMRRLDAVKRMLRDGQTLADAAAAAGFADQSHMTRHFSQAFGVSPARWVRFHGQAGAAAGAACTIVQDQAGPAG